MVRLTAVVLIALVTGLSVGCDKGAKSGGNAPGTPPPAAPPGPPAPDSGIPGKKSPGQGTAPPPKSAD